MESELKIEERSWKPLLWLSDSPYEVRKMIEVRGEVVYTRVHQHQKEQS